MFNFLQTLETKFGMALRSPILITINVISGSDHRGFVYIQVPVAFENP